MPIRQYECRWCDFRCERLEMTPDPIPLDCPRCRDEHQAIHVMERIPTAANFALKGDGWTRPSTYQKPKRATET
uniref:Uncharacterized protein n=1 Tax=viral metagenome TaxID=1070528 RepID=A0A6M3LK33_9ZZZZ